MCRRYMARRQPLKTGGFTLSNVHPVVLIPVLNEEVRIHSCIENCRALAEVSPLTVIFATSCSERRVPGVDNTIDIIRRYQKQYSWIKMYQCPVPGVMAHQLNHAIRAFQREDDKPNNVLYALYNVDSVISVSALSWVCARYASAQDRRVIYQQYGCYAKNWRNVAEQPWHLRGILRANMLWQTRWSVGFEIPHALMGRSRGKVWMLNYCIGHGLFFNDEVYRLVGGFEEETQNEDAMFGLQACLNNIAIIPVPELELADSPDMVASLLRQKTTWIYGPAQAWTYRRLILKRRPNLRIADRIRLTVLSLQLFEHSLRWVIVPALMLLGLLLCFCAPWPVVAVYAVAATTYLGGLDILCASFLPGDLRPTVRDAFTVIYGAFIQFGMHGLSGLIGFVALLRARWTGRRIVKGKTEMKQE